MKELDFQQKVEQLEGQLLGALEERKLQRFVYNLESSIYTTGEPDNGLFDATSELNYKMTNHIPIRRRDLTRVASAATKASADLQESGEE